MNNKQTTKCPEGEASTCKTCSQRGYLLDSDNNCKDCKITNTTECTECGGAGIEGQCNDCFDDKILKTGCNVCTKCPSCKGTGKQEQTMDLRKGDCLEVMKDIQENSVDLIIHQYNANTLVCSCGRTIVNRLV